MSACRRGLRPPGPCQAGGTNEPQRTELRAESYPLGAGITPGMLLRGGVSLGLFRLLDKKKFFFKLKIPGDISGNETLVIARNKNSKWRACFQELLHTGTVARKSRGTNS